MTTKQAAARAVAQALYTAEDAIDAAIREAARLTLAVSDARGDLRLAAVVGGEVFGRAATLHAGLAAARGQAAALHEALADVRDELRIRMDAPDFGSPAKPPKGAAQEEETAAPPPPRLHLRSA